VARQQKALQLTGKVFNHIAPLEFAMNQNIKAGLLLEAYGPPIFGSQESIVGLLRQPAATESSASAPHPLRLRK
jgi:hypothetical protein